MVTGHSFMIVITSLALSLTRRAVKPGSVVSDTDGDGTADQDTPTLVPLEMIHPIWEAGEKLALRDAERRKIKTFLDRNDDGAVDPGNG